MTELGARKQTIADVGEKRLIRQSIAPLAGTPATGIGVGDDAAVVRMPPGEDLVISTDKIPEDLLALRFGLMDPAAHGRYLAEVNISDIGAMGATPLGLLLTLALPDDSPLADVERFVSGFAVQGARWGAPLLGGDTGWATTPALSATAFGTVPQGRALLRSGARPGDVLVVSGEIGAFGGALAYFATAAERMRSLSAEDEILLRDRLVVPQAQVDLGTSLRVSGTCSACMDVTDGLGQSIVELGDASDVAFAVSPGDIPIAPVAYRVARLLDVNVMELVFGIGLELELLATLRCAADQLPEMLKASFHVIGHAVVGSESYLEDDGERHDLPGIGWQHFAGSALENVLKQLRHE